VLRDVLHDFVSRRAARKDYGVVLAGKPLAVDAVATADLRHEMRSRRNWDTVPIYDWGPALAAA
jgi:hypothetical protein